MSRFWRLITDYRSDPWWNMAVDEAILRLQAEDEGRHPVLRFYTWAPPALSLGYFQDPDRFEPGLKEFGVVMVKRPTGGGAVLHLGDITYSVVARVGRDVPHDFMGSYRYLCRGLVMGLSLLGVEVEAGTGEPSRERPDFCFASALPPDLTWRGLKLAGSAQKRLRKALLQHGSVLVKPQRGEVARALGPKAAAPLISVEEILGRSITEEEMAHLLAEGFARALGVELQPSALSQEEVDLARRIKAGTEAGFPGKI